MKRYWIVFPLMLSFLLSGCGLFDGSYLSVTPHQEHVESAGTEVVSAEDFAQLQKVVEDMVAQGVETGVIHVADFNQDTVEKHMETIASYIRKAYPIGAYAVEEIGYEVGTNSGRPAIAVNITYRHSRIEIQRIRKVDTMDSAKQLIGEALDNFESGIVIQVEDFSELDVSQVVEDHARLHPETVMETPAVAFEVYGTGNTRVLELTFTYQTSRDALRSMRSQVETVFASAALYVSGDGADSQKLSQLYGFLAERFDYKLETSITPAYSLLQHGVGDSGAFAAVYAAMCRQAGLECMIVTGTRNGEPWTWNIVNDGDRYYHVDILRSIADGGFREYLDADMAEYVWDYSAYPACRAQITPVGNKENKEEIPAGTQPDMETEETTVPEESAPELTEPNETESSTAPEETTEKFE